MDKGTNTQAAIYEAQNMLRKSDADLKYMVLVTDGEPNDGIVNKKGPDIATTTYPAPADNISDEEFYKVSFPWGADLAKKQADIAKKLIPGLTIFTIGYDMENTVSKSKNIIDTSKYDVLDVLNYIASKDKNGNPLYYHALLEEKKVTQDLKYAFNTMQNDLKQKIEEDAAKKIVKINKPNSLTDKIPKEFSIMEDTLEFDNTVMNANISSDKRTITWNYLEGKLATNSQKISFIMKLNMDSLSTKYLFNSPEINTNGSTIDVNNNSDKSAWITYESNKTIELASPKLSLPLIGNSVNKVRDINLNINGNIAGIYDPTMPKSNKDYTSAWTGSKVYFGSYGNAGPLLFRVLDANTTDYGEEPTMFLDCNNILKHQAFDNPTDSYYTDTATNVWAESDLRTWMNVDNKDEFLNQFSFIEKNSIASSTRFSDMGLGNGTFVQGGQTVKWVSVANDKVFPLDGKELTNPAYGYTNTREAANNRIKEKIGYSGSDSYNANNYWTRSEAMTSSGVKQVAIVGVYGSCNYGGPYHSGTYGASPALNLKLSSVLLSTAVGVDKTKEDLYEVTSSKVGSNTWNLTLLDTDKKIVLPKDEYAKLDDEDDDESEVEIPFSYIENDTNDKKVNQISVMITDKDYKEDEWPNM